MGQQLGYEDIKAKFRLAALISYHSSRQAQMSPPTPETYEQMFAGQDPKPMSYEQMCDLEAYHKRKTLEYEKSFMQEYNQDAIAWLATIDVLSFFDEETIRASTSRQDIDEKILMSIVNEGISIAMGIMKRKKSV